MREVDDAHDAEDDRQPERHQAVDEPGQQPADRDVRGRSRPAPSGPEPDGLTQAASRRLPAMRSARRPAIIRAWRQGGIGSQLGVRSATVARQHDVGLPPRFWMAAVLELVVLALGVELDARTDADIVGDVGRADRVGERLRVGRAGALVGVGRDQQRLEREDVVGVQVDAGKRLGERGLELLASASCSGRTRARSSAGRRRACRAS